MLKTIRNFLNGSVYGMTLIIPGVSATLLAIILKFYDELIWTINHFREDYRKNGAYLAAFLLGIIAGAVAFSSLIVYLLAHHAFPTMLFFTGLLAGMIPLIAAKAFARPGRRAERPPSRRVTPSKIALTLLSLAALVVLSRAVNVTALDPEHALRAANVPLLLYILLAGIINGATLVIPGFSGAFVLLVMGLYPLVISAISSVGVFFQDIGNFALLRDIVIVLLPFGIGGVAGCLGMARIMEKLLCDFNEAVYAVIFGLLLGSIVTLLAGHVIVQSDLPVFSVIIGVVMFCVGSAAAFILGKRH